MDKVHKKGYYPALTGMRAIAAYMVFLHHYNPFYPAVYGQSVFQFVNEFHVGVTLFFVLSGFLITFRYADSPHFSWKAYLLKRFARIYPIYLILMGSSFIISTCSESRGIAGDLMLSFFFNISLLKGFFADFIFTGIPQAWSLTVEECFYLLAPFIFLIIKWKRIYIALLPICFILMGILLVYLFSAADFYGFFGSLRFMFTYTFFGRCLEFFSGIALAMFIKNRKIAFNFSYFTYLGIANIFLIIYFISILKGDYAYGIFHPLGMILNTLFLPIFGICFLIYGLMHEKTLVSRILGNKMFITLGKSSYVFYLIHLGFISSWLQNFTTHFAILFFLVNIFSIVLYYLLEAPIRQWVLKKYSVSTY